MRKMILGFAVAIMLMAASAQAQGAVWSATFTPGDVNGYAVGCRNGDDDAECSNPSILSDDEFTVDGVVYTVTEFFPRFIGSAAGGQGNLPVSLFSG